MSVENIRIVLEEEESFASNLNLRPIILLGLATYIVVTIFAGVYGADDSDIADEEWIGKHTNDVLYFLGQPAEVVADGEGGSILKFRLLHVEDHHYAVERFGIFVTSSGEVYDFKRDS